MKKIFSLIIAITAMSMQAGALNVSGVTPGKLSALISGDPAAVTALSVSGSVDASDLKYIADHCTSLTSLDLSGAVIEAYDGDAINGMTQYAAGNIPAMTFAGSPLTSIVFPATQTITIGDGAFTASALQTVNLGSNVAAIGMGAFAACPALTAVTVGNADIAEAAFLDCPVLATADITGLQTSGKQMFARCTALATVNGTASLKNIADGTFTGCSSLTGFAFSPELQSIGNDAFALTSLSEVDLAMCTNLASIGDWAFARIPSLTTVNLHDNVSEIGQGAFFGCPSLVNYKTPESVGVIRSYTHTGNTALDYDGIVPEGVESIEAYALANMTGVTTLTLPSTLTYIGDNAMQNMTSLKSISAENLSDVPELGENVWDGVDQKAVNLQVHSSAYSDFVSAPQWQEFTISRTTGVDNIDRPLSPVGQSVRGRFLGSLLQIQSLGGNEITGVTLYDMSGRVLIDAKVNDTFVQVETAANPGNVFIAHVTLDDGNKAALKLVR